MSELPESTETRTSRLARLDRLIDTGRLVDQLVAIARANYENGGSANTEERFYVFRSLTKEDVLFLRSFTRDQLAEAIASLVARDLRVSTSFVFSWNVYRPNWLIRQLRFSVQLRLCTP